MHFIKLKVIIILMFLSIFQAFCKDNKFDAAHLREGDIIFHESLSEQAKAVKLATRSRYSHAGILFKHKGRFHVLEAVQPVKYTSLQGFIDRGKNKHFVIKRLKDYDTLMTAKTLHEMKIAGEKFLGKDYDLYFEWSDKRIYCTELIWKLYDRVLHKQIGKLQKLKDFDLNDAYVKRLLKKRYGNKIPYDEPVISPASMFESDVLMTIFENN